MKAHVHVDILFEEIRLKESFYEKETAFFATCEARAIVPAIGRASGTEAGKFHIGVPVPQHIAQPFFDYLKSVGIGEIERCDQEMNKVKP